MPSMVATKELHLAKSFEELRKKAELPAQHVRRKDLKGLVEIAEKFNEAAKKSQISGDEETVYFFTYRFVNIIDYVREDDKTEFLRRVNPKQFEECLQQLELLQERLAKRYQEKQKQHDDRKRLVFNNASSVAPGTSIKVVCPPPKPESATNNTDAVMADDDDCENADNYPTITARELIDSIHSQSSPINKVLIIDIRSAAEFEESSIVANKMKMPPLGEVNIINIPKSLFTPSMTYPTLAKSIKLGYVMDGLERRRSMDRVVIVDEGTHDFEKSSDAVILAMALFKWDQSPGCIKRKPYLLKGGYADFVLTYPTYVTNSGIINKPSFAKPFTAPAATLRSKDLYNFDEEEKNDTEVENQQILFNNRANNNNNNNSANRLASSAATPNKTPSSLINGFISNNLHDNVSINSGSSGSLGSGPFSFNNSNNFGSPQAINNNPFNFNQKFPGIAKPIIPDRSSKPNIGTLSSSHISSSNNKLKFGNDNDVSMKQTSIDSDDSDTEMLPSPSRSNNIVHRQIDSTNKQVNNLNANFKKSIFNSNDLLKNLPPKPDRLLFGDSTSNTSLDNGIMTATATNKNNNNNLLVNGYATTGTEKLSNYGDNKIYLTEDDDDELVAGRFDDDLNHKCVTRLSTETAISPAPSSTVLPTPANRLNETKRFNIVADENMSEDESAEDDDDEMIRRRSTAKTATVDDDIASSTVLLSQTKPIMVNRPNANVASATSEYYSAPSSLSRSLSSPNIAQFEQDSQHFSFNSSGGTPKFAHTQPMHHPIIDRSVKPLLLPYQALLRKPRDFSPQFSSCARVTGLRNLGNTCFMNSILQCLNNTYELANYFRSFNVHINPDSKFGSNGELTIELMELLKQMVYPSSFKHISPKDMKNAVIKHIPDFVEYKQQDAHEFLVRFLDRVHADLNKCANVRVDDPVANDPNYYDRLPIAAAANRFWSLHLCRNKSIITDLFEGLIVSTLTCLHCNYMSKALEAFTCLTLPVQEGAGRTSISVSLRMFLKHERITDEAAWQCPTCKQKRDAEKCTYIWKLPKILVIHLKRFSYDGLWRQKISTFVDFPIDNLTIESRGDSGDQSNRSYSLYGVVNHTGSLEGGHYIAYSRNLTEGIRWHRFDDQEVTPVTANEVITQNAYVLFYQQANYNNNNNNNNNINS